MSILHSTLMINILWDVSRQNLGVKGKIISVHEGENKHYQVNALSLSHTHTHTHTHAHTHTHTCTCRDITDSHLKKPGGFIFYKSSINEKVNVAVNKTKLLNCNTALSL